MAADPVLWIAQRLLPGHVTSTTARVGKKSKRLCLMIVQKRRRKFGKLWSEANSADLVVATAVNGRVRNRPVPQPVWLA